MTTILIILAVVILVLVLVIKSLDAQLTIMIRELNEIWKVLTELEIQTMGIKITIPKTKTPRALKLACSIASYLFEEEYGELQYFKASEIKTLEKANRMLGKVSTRTAKG